MGYAVNITLHSERANVRRIRSYVKSFVEDATGERVDHVVEHTSGQTSRERMQQLRRLSQNG